MDNVAENPKKNKLKNEIDFSDFSFLELNPPIINHDTFSITESDISDLTAFKALHDELVHPQCQFDKSYTEDEEDLLLLNDAKGKNNLSIFSKKQREQVKTLYPERSCLNRQQHLKCLRALGIVISGAEPQTIRDKNDMAAYKKLESKRFDEYAKFSEFVEKEWITKNNVRHMEIQPALKTFIHEYWKCRLSRALCYPQNYKIMSMLPLDNNSGCENRTLVEAFPQEIVYECGKCEKIALPTLNKTRKCINDYDTLVSQLPLEIKEDCPPKVPVSRDSVAIDLAQEYKTDVVISASALKCLLDNPPNYTRQWIIPIVVKEFTSKTDLNKKRTVFVDKPLPSIKLTSRELSQWAHKQALKASIITGDEESVECSLDDSVKTDNFSDQSDIIYSPTSPELPPSEHGDDKTDNEQTFLSDNCKNIDFGEDSESDTLLIDESAIDLNSIKDSEEDEPQVKVERVTRSMTKNKKTDCLKNIGSLCNPQTLRRSSRRQLDLQKDISDSDVSNNTEDVRTSSKRSHDVMSNMNSQLEMKADNDDTTLNTGDENMKSKPDIFSYSLRSPSEVLTIYRIWKMVEHGDSSESVLKKDSTKDLKVLIRSKIDGELKANGINKKVIIVPKLEYQMEFGAECLSLSESIRQWSTLYFNPSTDLVRVRLNPVNSEICSYDVRDLQAVTKETFRIYKHDPKRDLSRLFRILSIMSTSLFPGTYILKHDVTMKDGAKLYMADESTKPIQLDLHKLYENVNVDKINLQQCPWNSIDPYIITSKHKREGVLPCMFNWNFKYNRTNQEFKKKTTKPIQKYSNKAIKKKKRKESGAQKRSRKKNINKSNPKEGEV